MRSGVASNRRFQFLMPVKIRHEGQNGEWSRYTMLWLMSISVPSRSVSFTMHEG